ncbi:NADP-dependent oxidoreductase [Cyanobacteria bacterium FACHB-471]|nr:NADP-dependent oxidoreductase [Cyanobacteria bacterium FACHB-471]
MKALQMKAYGGSEVLIYQDTPKPEPQAGEVLIRVYAAGVNGIDWKIRDGELQRVFSFQLPMILGLDVAGTVAAVGAGVTAFQVGQDVYGTTERTRGGSFAEFAIANVDAIAPKPKSLNYVEAASIPAVALTAWQALFDKGSLTEGQTVLIHGAAGGVGMFAVQLAKWKGAKVIATASTSKLETVRSLGADEVIDYTTTRFETKVSGVDLVLDVLGGETRARSWQVLKPNGILVSMVPPPPQAPDGLHSEMVMMAAKGEDLLEISKLLETGQLKTIVERIFPLSETAQALELNKTGHAKGKVVVQVVA